MPTVPTLSNPQVRTAPLPTPQTSAAAQPLAGVVAGAGGAAQVVGREIQRVDEVRAQEQELRLQQALDAELYDPKHGILSQRGGKAVERGAEADATFDRLVSEAEADLTNDRQRQMFRERAMQRRMTASRQVNAFVANETQRLDAETYEALQSGDLEAVATNARTGNIGEAEASLARLSTRALEYGRRNGWTPEMIANARAEVVSTARTAQLVAMANTENEALISRARETFAKESGSMTERDRQIVERSLDLATKGVQEADLGRRTQQEANRILNATTSPTERNDLIANLPIELRKGVRDLVRAEQNAAKEARELEQEASFATLEAAVQRGIPLTDPRLASDLVRVSTSQRQTLERYAMAPTNDNAAWLTFYEMSPDEIAKMSESQFRSHWSRLSVAHRDDAERMRKAATEETTGPDGVRGYVTPQERIARAMREVAGLSPFEPMTQAGEVQQEAAVRFQNAADLALRQLPENKRRDPDEIQKTLDNLRLETFRTVQTDLRGPFAMALGMAPFRTREVTQPLFEFSGDAFSRGVAAGVTTFPSERIPDRDRQRVRNILTGNGLAGTDRQIEQYYTAEVFGTDVSALLTRLRGR